MNRPQSLPQQEQQPTMAAEIVSGLQSPRKQLPCKFFYDAHGSELFRHITEQEEYYLTRAELALMDHHVATIAERVGPDCMVVEYGSGASLKTRLLLNHLDAPCCYVPIEIDSSSLQQSVQTLRNEFPWLTILPLCADYTQDLNLPQPPSPPRRKLVYFPGSTIGNFPPPQAVDFLRAIHAVCGRNGGALIGVDLKKDIDLLETAYNDANGITAEFNLNILRRINHELGANFQLDQFAHHAVYDEERGCIEMRLISLGYQVVSLGDTFIRFTPGETILTEYAYKYSLPEFQRLAQRASFAVQEVWTDPQGLFSLQYLTPSD